MTKWGFAAFALTAIALLWSPSANANTIVINGGESPTFPPSFTTLLAGGSPVTLPQTACCGINDSFLVQANAEGTPSLPMGDFDSDTISLSMGPGTLILWFTETGLTSPVPTASFTSSLTSNSIIGGITSVTLSTFISPSNSVSPPNGTPLDSMTFTGLGTQTSTTTVATSASYSLQEVYTIVATGVGNANLTIDITASAAAVPEPVSLALLGSALAGFGLLLRRRRAVR